MASDEETKWNVDENFEWNVENEIRLFEAMIGHKPVGINKHFYMACISEKFENLIGKPVNSDVIWKHLNNMFDLKALDKKEVLPFPNDPEEFSLPEAEFSDLINEKIAVKTDNVAETKESTKEVKTSIKAMKDSAPAKDLGNKKEKKSDTEETGSNEGEKKESGESEGDIKRGKISKEDKPVKRRGNRSAKEKKSEEDTPLLPASGIKKEEDSSSVSSSHKKEKQGVGKRSLRSRNDDSLSSKSLTPPPAKRARRI